MQSSRSVILYLTSIGIASLISTKAMAWDQDNFLNTLYLGADLQARHQPFKADFGHNLFRNHLTQGNFYGGVKFNCNVGLEFGYEEGRSRNRQTTLTAGEIVTGVEIPPELAPAVFRNESRIAGYHLDLMGYYSQCEEDPLKLIGSVGFIYARGTFSRTTVSMADLPGDVNRVFTRRRLVARAMAGLQYRFFDCLSARGSLIYENTKGLKSICNDASGVFINQVRPEDSVIAGIGLVWHF